MSWFRVFYQRKGSSVVVAQDSVEACDIVGRTGVEVLDVEEEETDESETAFGGIQGRS